MARRLGPARKTGDDDCLGLVVRTHDAAKTFIGAPRRPEVIPIVFRGALAQNPPGFRARVDVGEPQTTHESSPPPCDVLLFVTTQTELQTLETVATELGYGWEEAQSSVGRYFDLGMVGNNRVLAVRTKMGSLRFRGAAWQAIWSRST